MKRVSKEDIKLMNELYLDYGTYAAVARKVGFTAATVKRYIIPDYQRVDETKVQRFNEELPSLNIEPFICKNWSSLCLLTNEEKLHMPELWEEMSL